MNRAFTIEEHGAFRSLLDAMSRPGTVHRLSDSVADRDGALALLARTLLDAEVSVAGAAADDEPSVRSVARASGCRVAE
ncbi:MAG TPA: phosphonate C-P lyase system protein PhnH, partial [Fibrobacteria bacterium]|nr:phosphonate C-P lyase system protein PhnH [Fibrobacteria bacterium]